MKPRIFTSGELDIATALALQAELEAVIAGTDENVLVDFTNVTFIDSSGARVLIVAREKLDAEGRTLRIVNAQP